MKIRYAPRATQDLGAILSYIDERSSSGSLKVKSSLKHTLDYIEQNPEGGRLTGKDTVRVIPVHNYPYLIYWIVEKAETWIIHIRHTSRAPGNPRR